MSPSPRPTRLVPPFMNALTWNHLRKVPGDTMAVGVLSALLLSS
jgi:hypothetical protein